MQANYKAHAFLLPIMFSTEKDELLASLFLKVEREIELSWRVDGNLFHSIGPLTAKQRFP